jgi:hypothetical protein
VGSSEPYWLEATAQWLLFKGVFTTFRLRQPKYLIPTSRKLRNDLYAFPRDKTWIGNYFRPGSLNEVGRAFLGMQTQDLGSLTWNGSSIYPSTRSDAAKVAAYEEALHRKAHYWPTKHIKFKQGKRYFLYKGQQVLYGQSDRSTVCCRLSCDSFRGTNPESTNNGNKVPCTLCAYLKVECPHILYYYRRIKNS